MSENKSPRRVHYVLSTHWDREWYEPFQHYRFRLVNLLDHVIDGLESGRLQGPFTTDGQAIILEDYLEIRPEKRALVEKLAREGRFNIGPWYVLPDEFIVSGEAHLRNIRLGREIARSWGVEPSNAGFVCDLFGHISQLPQIFNGFGITSAFTWRGINMDHKRGFVWTGADGSELVAYRFSPYGYSDLSKAIRESFSHGLPFDEERCEKNIDEFLAYQAEETETASILFFDGGDHLEWEEPPYHVLAKRFGKSGEFEFLHSTLDAFAAEFVSQKDSLTTHLHGELRDPGRTFGKSCHLIPGVLSSRIWIKQRNSNCQNDLCHWLEPIGALANVLLDVEYPKGYLDFAWKTLLENHPHDSICGCSVDTVHEDMKYRFSQVEQVTERVTRDRMRRITASVEGEVGEGELRVGVFNPLPHALDETVEVDLEIPEDWPLFNEFFGFESKPAFRVYTADGAEVPYQRLSQVNRQNRTRIWPKKFPQPYIVNVVRVSLPVSIPAMGYTTLTVRKGEPNFATRHPQDTGLAVGKRTLQNEYIRVEITCNGSLNLTDLSTGEVYSGLNNFEDNADIGDGWYHGVALADQVFDSNACPADIVLIENGPRVSAFKVTTRMRVPREFDFAKMVRSSELVELEVTSVIRLRPGSRHVEIETSLDNRAKDHRLRVLFPTNTASDVYHSDTAFDMVERPVSIRKDNHEYMELEVETTPMQTWTAVHDAERGLAVISVGQLESCVRDLEERPLALTLFRCTRRTVLSNGEPEGQLLGPLSFRYWVTPMAGRLEADRLFRLGQKLAAGFRYTQIRPLDLMIDRMEKPLPACAGLLEIDGPVVMTSSRQVEGKLEVRLFNPHDTPVVTRLKAAPVYTRGVEVDFESNPGEGVYTSKEGVFSLQLAPKKILTISLERA